MNDGINQGFADFGTLALFAIPYVLGLAACVWLGFLISARGFNNQLNQERRRAIYVGAEVTPKSPLEIEIINTGIVKITKVDLDGETAMVYFTNQSAHKTQFIKINWQLVSPDGTKLSSGCADSEYCGGPGVLEGGGKGEAVLSGHHGISFDKRAVKVQFWAGSY